MAGFANLRYTAVACTGFCTQHLHKTLGHDVLVKNIHPVTVQASTLHAWLSHYAPNYTHGQPTCFSKHRNPKWCCHQDSSQGELKSLTIPQRQFLTVLKGSTQTPCCDHGYKSAYSAGSPERVILIAGNWFLQAGGNPARKDKSFSQKLAHHKGPNTDTPPSALIAADSCSCS